ncbi:hypothetical protein [Moorena sp. SIO4G3]|uniref:hypothetical protein n=1 Tax=Moorena sp. SIO4G3 TaxID=2607821 RepID=UPI00142BED5A|nr:hypothetical protein [Moorena sp. SIO4G3]NEO74743.1 hypothetical protein [Moorena sp. SIO4G3]
MLTIREWPMEPLNVPDKYDQRDTNSGNYRYRSISSRKKNVKPSPLLPCSPAPLLSEPWNSNEDQLIKFPKAENPVTKRAGSEITVKEWSVYGR